LATEEEQKRLNRLLEEYNRSLEETVKKQDSVSKGMKEEVSLLERKMKLLSLQNKELADALEFAEKEEKLQKNEIKANEKELKDAIKLGKLSEEEVKQAKAKLALQKESNKQGEKAAKHLAKRKKQEEDISRKMKLQQEYSDGFVDNLKRATGLGAKFGETMTGGAMNWAANWTKNLAQGREGMSRMGMAAESMGDAIGGGIGFIVKTIEESILGLDTMQSRFVQATQGSEAFAESAGATFDVLRSMGVASDEAAGAIISLYENTVEFRRASPALRTEFGAFAAQMQQAGVDSKITSETFQLLNKTMGLQGKELIDTTTELRTFGQTVGISVNRLLLDMSAAAPTLAAHGKNMVNVFKGLAAQAEATGLNVSDLLSIAGQFDTFDQSAEAVGKLNSILGGPFLNSIDMVYMSEEERIAAMRNALELSGKSFDSMSRYEKKAFDAAAGVNNLAKSQELFGTASEEVAEAAAKAGQEIDQGETIKETAKRATTAGEEIKQMFTGMVPVFRDVKGVLDEILIKVEEFRQVVFPKLESFGIGLKDMFLELPGIISDIQTKLEPVLTKALRLSDVVTSFQSAPEAAQASKVGFFQSLFSSDASGTATSRGASLQGIKADGGYIQETGNYKVHKGEYIIPARQVAAAGLDPSTRPSSLTDASAIAAAVKEGVSQALASLGAGTNTVVQLNLDGKQIHNVVVDHMRQRAVERPA